LTPLRAVAYVTRGDELLVFQEDGDERVQVPAGRSDADEPLEETLHRELLEEVGVEARLVREIGVSTRNRGGFGVYESHYFHCETDDARDAWTHVIKGAGDDAGIVAHCRFVPIREAQLAGDLGEFLHELT
jgi:8-oxo-dGTP pyrophosphatase MutT (NUDIX family)